ncbi:MAG: putative hydroxymethylpyrimidine transporter CytX [Acidobacteriota bacterium]|nr:MAG: putative hydroxymethylpyrimidine transporter CytX [Acidobacteriota bacterium]
MDIRPVSAEGKTLGGLDFFWLWAGVAISLAEIWAGGFLAPMGFWLALGAIILGHVFGNTLMALGGVIGSDHGIPAMVSVRPSFGVRGSNFASILNVVQLVCWASIMLIIGGRAGAMLGEPIGGIFASNRFWILCIGAGTLGWALFTGQRVWKILQAGAVIGLLAVISILSFETYQSFINSPDAMRPHTGDGPTLPFMAGLDLVIAMPISWLPLVADYSRFAHRGRGAFWSTWWGYFLVSSWMFVLGLMATLVTGTAEPHIQMLELMGSLGLAVPALLMVVFSTITSDFPDLYSATCSMLNVSDQIDSKKMSAKAFLWITGIVSILVALVFPMERYENFLYFIGAMFVPLFGIVLTDYFLVRKRKLDLEELYQTQGAYWYSNGFNLTALIAWAAGFATYELIETLEYPVGASLPSIAVSAFLYYCYTLIRSRR